MQPYYLPYLGYFQLVAAVDRFIIYDDVQFINRGWINRNRITGQNKDWSYFNVQLRDASQTKAIFEVGVEPNDKWRRKALATLRATYGKSPYFDQVFPVAESIVNCKEIGLSEFLFNSIQKISELLDLKTTFVSTSREYGNIELTRANRLQDICQKEGFHHYVNAIGGQELYNKEDFAEAGIKLSFLEPDLSLPEDMALAQVQGTDLGLSIVHLLFQYGPEVCHHLVHRGRLV
jgi:hypothetical protein